MAWPAQFRPGPPPALSGPIYARDLSEIATVGRETSSARTAAQAQTARFWVATAPQLWNQIVQQLVAAHGLEVTTAARAFALLNLAGADAFIASWDAKFTYRQWRPITGIREAATASNPATFADPEWTPLLETPPFPDYPAAHMVYAGAAEEVLSSLFGTTPGGFEISSPTAGALPHHYSSIRAVADEVVQARVWGGVHWRTSCTAGRIMGQRIGRYAVGIFRTHAPDGA